MLIDEMFEYIITKSGQFLIGANKVELNRDKFAVLVKGALGIFSGYKPVDFTFNLRMQQTRRYTFLSNFQPIPETGEVWGIPKFISSVTPVAIVGSPAFSLMGQFGSKFGWSQSQGQYANKGFAIPGQTQLESQQMEKSQFPWIWRSPDLYIPYSADVDVCAVWHHKMFEVPADETENGQITWNVPTIDFGDDEFFDLLEGMFLQALGQSRRAFTLNDLPITSDADTLASDGKALVDAAVEDLRTNKSKFYLAYGD